MLRIGKGSSETIRSTISDLYAADTWRELATCLSIMKERAGLSYADLERIGGPVLERRSVSEVLSGRARIPRPMLEGLLTACEAPDDFYAGAFAAWERLTDRSQQDRPGMPRFAELSPRALRVHDAIRAPGATGDMPLYVPRKFDHDLRAAISHGTEQGCFTLLIGQSSTGKTRSLYEAVNAVAPRWWLTQPESTADVLALMDGPAEQTVVWLDDFHRFLASTPALTRSAVNTLVKAGMIVVGTLSYDEFNRVKSLGRTPDRELIELALPISVQPRFTDAEYRAAAQAAASDQRIKIALSVRDAGLTQVLAGGPDLMLRWEQAPPYAHAAITAAADAFRLGVHAPLPDDLLLAAMTDYLSRTERAAGFDVWVSEMEAYAKKPVHEAVTAPLRPVAGRRPGTPAGFVAADYLAQSLRQSRRDCCPPESLWTALIERLDSPDDLRRVGEAAGVRMRYGLQESVLRRLCAFGDRLAHVELAELLARQDRLTEAIALLGRSDHTDALDRIIMLRGRAELLRDAPARLAELLFDGGETEDLRTRADRGDVVAADDLAYLLADRGALADLRTRAEAGHRLAADLLAELLATHRRLAELTARAAAGDDAAALRLSKVEADDPLPDVREEITALRADIHHGHAHAAERLTALLFEQRAERELRAEVDAGTPFAAERLVALMRADEGEFHRLRVYGLDADGNPA